MQQSAGLVDCPCLRKCENPHLIRWGFSSSAALGSVEEAQDAFNSEVVIHGLYIRKEIVKKSRRINRVLPSSKVTCTPAGTRSASAASATLRPFRSRIASFASGELNPYAADRTGFRNKVPPQVSPTVRQETLRTQIPSQFQVNVLLLCNRSSLKVRLKDA